MKRRQLKLDEKGKTCIRWEERNWNDKEGLLRLNKEKDGKSKGKRTREIKEKGKKS